MRDIGLMPIQILGFAASGDGSLRACMVRWWRNEGYSAALATDQTYSSAKDQLTGQAVAVKKIMKPFSTPVLSKRTYRELKLLKHLKHENVISLSDIFISPLEDMYVGECFLTTQFAYHVSQLFCHRIAWNRFAPPSYLAASREAVHPVLPLPDSGESNTFDTLQNVTNRNSAA